MLIDSSPFEWLTAHIHLIGWPSVAYAAWKLSRLATQAESRLLTAESRIAEMATNHFPHMQSSLENIDREMGELLELAKKKLI